MMGPQGLAFAILALALALFVWGRFRHDIVAMFALLACVLTGLVPAADAFNGFGHPAVITVAAVLVISRGLQNAGLIDFIAKQLAALRGRPRAQIAAESGIIVCLSAFMNNVGALALMLPVALRNAYRDGYPPAKALMPLAFASLLGGLITLIGTPPNIIVSAFRERATGAPFALFDYAPVGLAVAAAGLLFMIAFSWRLLPGDERKPDKGATFAIENYIAEAIIPDAAKAGGMTVDELEKLADYDVVVATVIRDGTKQGLPSSLHRLRPGDELVLRGDMDAIQRVIDGAELDLQGEDELDREDLKSEDIDLVEAVISPGSRLIGQTTGSARLRTLYGVNLLALARQGRRIEERLRDVGFRAGDVMLLQGPRAGMGDILSELGMLPLAARDLGLGGSRHLALAGVIFVASIVLTLTGWLPAQVSFAMAAVAFVTFNIVRPSELYTAIDWPVIVLLGAMLPVGTALETTGGAALIARTIVDLTAGLGAIWVLFVLMAATMTLSDVINNSATAVLMAPIGLDLAARLGASTDAFLMAVAIGASCAFLTPIGHQSNMLVMEPAGYRFGDYWKLGLPLQIVLAAVGLPMIVLIWGL